MRYVPYDEIGGSPNIVVDGFPTEGTVLTLSHWRGSGSPEDLADDLSTQIVLRYLDRPDLAVHADAVSNDHFDEDGLSGIYAILNPDQGLAMREMLADVAAAGDFGTYRIRDAARVVFSLGAWADPKRSPLGPALFEAPYPQQTAALYEELLGRLPEMLADPGKYRNLWEAEDAALARDEERLRSGEITIAERPDIDLAIVTFPASDASGVGEEWSGGCHPMAIHNATERHRLLIQSSARSLVRYRYETWVRFVSRPTMPRIDLAPLAEILSHEERAGTWVFDGVERLTPALRLEGGAESAIAPERVRSAVVTFLEQHAARA